jgi:protein involved in polysaccharide export with SLBB domain
LRLPVSLRRLARPAAAATLLAAAVLAGGCDLPSNGDPAEMAGLRSRSHELLPVRILDKIDPAIEEPDVAFASASLPRPEDLRAPIGDYKISRNDTLTISISDLQGPGIETVKQTKVSESGNISLPYIGQVHAEGLTEIDLEKEIVAAYRRANLIEQATVSVVVFEARGRAYSILGAVQRSGVYAIVEADYRVLDAITAAGETTSIYANTAYVIRRLDERPTPPMSPADQGRMNDQQPGPSGDDLAPRSRSDAGATGPQKVLQLAQDVAPGSRTAQPGRPADEDDRIINLDGRDVPATRTGQRPAAQPTTRPAGAGAGAMAQPGRGAAGGTGARPSTNPGGGAGSGSGASRSGGFEFNELAPPPDIRVIRIPLDELRKGDLRYNVVVRARDTIYIPPAEQGTYYMGGHVTRPGAYTLNGQRVTLKQAIIAASMLDPLAIPQRTDVVRRLGPVREVWVRVDLAKLFAGTQPDVFLKPDDQVLVGTNAIAPYLAAFRNAFRITYGAGFIYDRNFAYDKNVFGGGGL